MCPPKSGYYRTKAEAVPPKNNDHQSYDLDLEGVRSLGAVPADQGFVCSGKGMCRTAGSLLAPRLRGTAALQVRNRQKTIRYAFAALCLRLR